METQSPVRSGLEELITQDSPSPHLHTSRTIAFLAGGVIPVRVRQ